mmetsp:Transcript_25608/g.76152  ORF Transcript_25608/g.76152 Transcript_25608/m.76152 type:complete len:214 (-) Transcript_25608:1320-1961(-)
MRSNTTSCVWTRSKRRPRWRCGRRRCWRCCGRRSTSLDAGTGSGRRARGTRSTARGWSRAHRACRTAGTPPTSGESSTTCGCGGSGWRRCSVQTSTRSPCPPSRLSAWATLPSPQPPRATTRRCRPARPTRSSRRFRASTRSLATYACGAAPRWTSARRCCATRRRTPRSWPEASRWTRWRTGWAAAASRSPSRRATSTSRAISTTTSPSSRR